MDENYDKQLRKIYVRFSDFTQIYPHEKVRSGQIANQKSWYVQFTPGKYYDEDDGAVAQHREEEDDPHTASQSPPVEQVLARQEWS